jgi:GH3 auxin-responsive promoter
MVTAAAGAALANAAWWAASTPSWVAFHAALDDPARAQEQVLRRLLKRNADTAFGREHGFAEIRTPEQFASRVPPREYDDVRPWVERVRRGEARVLTGEPVLRLVPTSGSSAARKLVPYTASMQRELNRAIGPWISDLYRQHPGAARGPAYWSITPVAEQASSERDESAVPIGFDDDADYLGGWRKHAVAAVMAVPAVVGSIREIDLWRYVTLLLLLRRRDLALVSVWHPSFLDLLLRAMRRDWDRLIADVAGGGCAVLRDLPQPAAAAAVCRPLSDRARELARTGPGDISRIWKKLRVMSCWADGNAAAAAADLSRAIPGVTLQPKGLLATEGVVSIPYRGRHPLAIRSHFLEFEDDTGRTRLAADLRNGAMYTVLLTTAGGLYRYRLHDVVRVDGRVGRTPSVRFVGKARLVSDRVGEKLSDSFVSQVLAELFGPDGPRPSFAMLAPDVDAAGCRYTLYVNAAVSPAWPATLDALLARNPQYAYCRRLGQLNAPVAVRVHCDPYAAYADRLRQLGQKLGDIKPAALSPLDGWSTVFAVNVGS